MRYAYLCRQVWAAHDRLVYVLSIMYTVVVCGGFHKGMQARIEDGFWGQRSFYLPLLTLYHCRCLRHAGRGRARAGLPILARNVALEFHILLHLAVQGVYRRGAECSP